MMHLPDGTSMEFNGEPPIPVEEYMQNLLDDLDLGPLEVSGTFEYVADMMSPLQLLDSIHAGRLILESGCVLP